MTALIPFSITGYDSFDEMYRSERPLVYGVIFRITGDRHLTEDLIQDTFEKALLKLGKYVPQDDNRRESLRKWLSTVARHTTLNRVKRKTVERKFSEQPRGELSYSQTPFTPEEMVSQRQSLETIEEALEGPFRETARLRSEGFSCHEISEMQKIPKGTVLSRLYRAREKLQKALEDSL